MSWQEWGWLRINSKDCLRVKKPTIDIVFQCRHDFMSIRCGAERQSLLFVVSSKPLVLGQGTCEVRDDSRCLWRWRGSLSASLDRMSLRGSPGVEWLCFSSAWERKCGQYVFSETAVFFEELGCMI